MNFRRNDITYWPTHPIDQPGEHWKKPPVERIPAPQPKRIRIYRRPRWYQRLCFLDWLRIVGTLILIAGIGVMLAWRG